MKIGGSASAYASGSESGSGSISQRHGSADPDPDPQQNVMDHATLGPPHFIHLLVLIIFQSLVLCHCFTNIGTLSHSTVPVFVHYHPDVGLLHFLAPVLLFLSSTVFPNFQAVLLSHCHLLPV
jgi:hypothetical protein